MRIITNKHSIVYKIILIFLISIFMPTILICTLYYNVVSVNYEKNILTYFEIVLNQYISSVDNQLERYKETMEILWNEKEILELSENPDVREVYDISGRFMPNMMSEGHIYRCTLYTEKDSPDNEYTFKDASSEDWFIDNIQNRNYGKWFYSETPGREIPLISIIYPVWENYADGGGQFGPKAILKLDLYLEKIFEEFFPREWDENIVDCVIYTETRKIVWQKGDEQGYVSRIVLQSGNIESLPDQAAKLGGNDGVIRCKKVGNQNLYIICKMQKNHINNIMIKEKIYFFAQVILMFIILIIALGLFMRSFSKKITTIRNKIKKIGTLDFSSADNVGGNDEFALIDMTIDKMQMNLNEQINKNYKQQLRLREAELNALYFQINPHFLYNSLESISEIAYIEGSEKAASMSQKLGQMFRYSVSPAQQGGKIKLRDEIKYIESYLEIQNIRFDDKFKLILEISDEFMSENILKFSLQPLVENSVRHAFAEKKSGNIGIKAYKIGKDLCIEVTDDGAGITPENLKKIKDNMHSPESTGEKGIGLNNINNRLVLEYGTDYEIEIISQYGKGTKIILRYYMEGAK